MSLDRWSWSGANKGGRKWPTVLSQITHKPNSETRSQALAAGGAGNQAGSAQGSMSTHQPVLLVNRGSKDSFISPSEMSTLRPQAGPQACCDLTQSHMAFQVPNRLSASGVGVAGVERLLGSQTLPLVGETPLLLHKRHHMSWGGPVPRSLLWGPLP